MIDRRFARLAAGLAAALALAGCGSKDAAGAGNGAGAAGVAASAATAVPAPAGKAWVDVVAKTPDGGFRMGNPDAPVKLVEYGALSCSHCAAFAAEGLPELQARYVATGRVSYELRNYMLNPLDVPAALLTRCRGAEPYYKLTEQMFQNQAMLFDNYQKMTQADRTRVDTLPDNQRFLPLAQSLGLIQFFKVRGLPEAQAKTCLTDQAALDELTKISARAVSEFNLTGTPTFVLNGRTVPNVASWDLLRPALDAAIGG